MWLHARLEGAHFPVAKVVFCLRECGFPSLEGIQGPVQGQAKAFCNLNFQDQV